MLRRFNVIIVLGLIFIFSTAAFALNGANLIGIGPLSRTMGGASVAAPQDAISAISANPAGISNSEAIFSVTILDPNDIVGTVDLSGLGMGIAEEKSKMEVFLVPAMAITSSITDNLMVGIGVFGTSGFGVDYKNASPLFKNLYTKLEIIKFSPAVAYKVNSNLSLGVSLNAAYANFDLGSGASHDYSYGAQFGALYRMGIFRFGASYLTSQRAQHERLSDLDLDGTLDSVNVEAPQSVAFGVAIEPFETFLLAVDTKWYNWADAEGYEDFDWKNQWIFAIGAQYKPISKLALRAGFNYGENPIPAHNGFNPFGTTNFQGLSIPTLNYEVLRVIGSPVIFEKHLTMGIGYELSDLFVINAGYAHAFESTMSEESALALAKLKTTSKGDTYEFGITWRF